MNTSYSQTQTAAAPMRIPTSPEKPCENAGRRLVVVLQESEEEAVLASRILALAGATYPRVILLGISPDSSRQTELRRRLVTIGAFLREQRQPADAQNGLTVDIRIEQGAEWVEKVRTLLGPDDALACYDEQSQGIGQRRLYSVLSANFPLPVYVFSGLARSSEAPRRMLNEAACWLGSTGSVGGFFVLQAKIVGSTQGAAQVGLILLTLFAEVAVIWIWNSILA